MLGWMEIAIIVGAVTLLVFAAKNKILAIGLLGLGCVILLMASFFVARRVTTLRQVTRDIPVETTWGPDLIRSVEHIDGELRFRIKNQMRHEQTEEIQRLAKNFVPDVHATGVAAAESLALQVVGRLRAEKLVHFEAILAININGFRNAGRDALESELIMNRFRDTLSTGLQNTQVRVVVNPEDEAVELKLDRADAGEAAILQLTFELQGRPYRFAGEVAGKAWLRDGAIGDEGERFVEFGVLDPSNGDHVDNSAVSRAAERITPILVSKWDLLRSSDWESSKALRSAELKRDVVKSAIVDDLLQTFETTIDGAPLETPDKREFLLVDYSDANLTKAIRAAEIEWGAIPRKAASKDSVRSADEFTIADGQGTESAHPVASLDQASRGADATVQVEVVPFAALLVVIYLVVLAVSRVYDKPRGVDLREV